MKIQNNISFCAKPIPQNHLSTMIYTVNSADKIDIITHKEPDSDAGGSSIALALAFKQLNKKVRIVIEDDLPSMCQRLIKKINNINPKEKNDLELSKTVFITDLNLEERLPYSVRSAIKENSLDIIGLDHHEILPETIKGIYVDEESQSASELAYQFIKDGLKVELTEPIVESCYHGMVSDLRKSGLVKLNKTDEGIYYIVKTPEFPEDSLKTLEEIESKISSKRQNEILCEFDIMANLTKEQQEFRKNLYKKIQFNEKNKLAYVIIPPEDKEWKKLGQDNSVTSMILGDFRMGILNGTYNKDFVTQEQQKKLENINIIAVFYRGSKLGNPQKEDYKGSYTSRGDEVLDIIKKLNTKNISAGGHPNRAGSHLPVKNWESLVNTVIE
ncbi:MAG: DHH family phosphoesterase [Candidatus Gastranaerophilales bacterium]|nr:DHH family phosphoesterase [Candidatus Gastranaerophilales bacterium]